MNILITGGIGFVGLHISQYLVKQGHSITIFDNFNNSQNKIMDPNIQIIKGDILDFSLLTNSMNNVEIVIHLAALISVRDSIKNPKNTLNVNVKGTENLLDACLENNVKNFIAASSAAVFENKSILPLTEESPTNPISPYGKSKLLMEEKILDFSKKHNLNSIILRFFNLYGTGQSSQYAGVITKFLDNIKENKPLEIYGDGNQTRDFIHIDDAIESISLAIKNIDKKNGKIYNIASGKSTSILELANLLLKLSGKTLPINFKPEIKGDILHSKTSIALVKKELGFEPKTSLKEGLSRFFQDSS